MTATAISNSIEMKASPDEVFDVVSDLPSWPRHLPHYRWIRVLEKTPNEQLVGMACYRGFIPVNWVSQFRADRKTLKLHFLHQKAFTRGMEVIWHLEASPGRNATRVTIKHNMDRVSERLGGWVAHQVIGNFFIDYVATRTLRHFALHFSRKAGDSDA
jgi:ribosome-associated toxin RatA of RatAB toxin-antitoxin module